jgi:adenylate cyclase
MSDAVFLNEIEAALVIFDLKGFSHLAATLAPLDLGLALARYYAHAEKCIEDAGGRLVKFAGDAVLGCWLANETPWPRTQAATAVAAAQHDRAAFLARCRAEGMPELDYTVAASAGPLLAGQIGTERHKSFDVIGEAVNVAFKLGGVLSSRAIDHVLAFVVQDYDMIEIEGIELGGKRMRLFRLADERAP